MRRLIHIVIVLLCGIDAPPCVGPWPHAAALAQNEPDAATKALLAANGLFERGHFKLAADDYEQFLKDHAAHPQAAHARYSLAICHYRLSSFDKAVPLLDKVLGDGQFDKKDEALAVLGHCHLSMQANDKALATFERLLREYGKSPHAELAALNRAQVLYLLNRKDEAAKAADQYISRYPQSGRIDAAIYFASLARHDTGKFADAAAALDKLVKERADSPYHLDAVLLLGRCLEGAGRFSDAAAQYRRMLDLAPSARKAEALYNLGAALYRAGQFPQAMESLNAVVSQHADDPYAGPARLQLALSQLAADKPDDARRTLQQVVEKDPPRADAARYWIAQCDIAQEKFDDAQRLLDELAQRNPPPANIERIHFDRAECRLARRQYEDAANHFNEFCNRYPNSEQFGEARYRQAFCLHRMERYDQSLDLCRQVVERLKSVQGEPAARTTRHARQLAAENLFLTAKYEEADNLFNELIAAEKDDVQKRVFVFRRAQCGYFRERFDAAIELLKPFAADPVLASHDVLDEALFVYGDALLQAGQHERAAAALGQYVKQSKNHPQEAAFKLGLSQLRAGNAQAAAATFEAMVNGPNDSPWVQRAWFEVGQLWYRRQQPDQARPLLERVVASAAPPALKAPAAFLLAWIDYDAARFQPAADRFAQVVNQYGDHDLIDDARYQHAMCLRQLEHWDRAEQAFRQYEQAHPNGPHIRQARYQIGLCLARQQKHEQAIAILSALANDKNAATDGVLYDLAWSQRAHQDAPGAVATYRRLIEQHPQSKLLTPARVELAELLYVEKKYDEASKLLEQATSDAQAEPRTLAVGQYRLGWCYTQQDQHLKSAQMFERFVASNPKDDLTPSAYYQMGLAWSRAGRNDESAKAFAALLQQFPSHDLASVARLKLGESLAELGRFDESIQVHQQFLNTHPDDAFAYLARFGIGWAHENQKRYEEARQWYRQVIAKHNGATAARAQFQIGETHFAEKQFESAARELLKVDIVYDYPDWSSKALLEAGRAFEQLNLLDRAKQQYEQCVAKYKDSAAAQVAAKRLREMSGS